MGVMKDFDIRIRSGGDDAIAAVSELMPRWIPVTERLPDESVPFGHCLVTDGSNVETANYCHVNGWNVHHHTRWTPTHWMPFPEPPKVTR